MSNIQKASVLIDPQLRQPAVAWANMCQLNGDPEYQNDGQPYAYPGQAISSIVAAAVNKAPGGSHSTTTLLNANGEVAGFTYLVKGNLTFILLESRPLPVIVREMGPLVSTQGKGAMRHRVVLTKKTAAEYAVQLARIVARFAPRPVPPPAPAEMGEEPPI
jgi:hypothetical protein